MPTERELLSASQHAMGAYDGLQKLLNVLYNNGKLTRDQFNAVADAVGAAVDRPGFPDQRPPVYRVHIE